MLTVRQRQTLTYIKGYVEAHGGIAPSVVEIGTAVHASKGGVHRLLRCLEERGCIRRMTRKARAIEVIPEKPTGYPPLVHYPNARYYLWDDEAKALKPMKREP